MAQAAHRMNTTAKINPPILPAGGDYEFILEDLELTFDKAQLKRITKTWNQGASVEYISKKEKRHIEEVFLALFHQARKGVIKRPFAYRHGVIKRNY